MIKSITQLIEAIRGDLSFWDAVTKPWFRGESGNEPPLRPKIAAYATSHENHLLQSFRRQAGGLANVPPRGQTDLWLFLAQHYGVPTRLLDWTEGALHAFYFAINRGNPNARVYMLNPRKLNELAGIKTYSPNYPLTWGTVGGPQYISLAWQNRVLNCQQQELLKGMGVDLDVPIAFPATYQDPRMIAQRSCFTIHGSSLCPMQDILAGKNDNLNHYLVEYKIDGKETNSLLRELSLLGVSAATIFPDLDHLAQDLVSDLQNFNSSTE